MKHNNRRNRAVICLVLAVLITLIWPVTACRRQTVDLHGFRKTDAVSDTVAIVMHNATEAVIIRLRPDKAPGTVENFQTLTAEGFYDGLTFHRVVDGTLIQGGDPDGNGRGGPGYTIVGEFSLNRISNDLNHERGSVSMARGPDYDSAGSQFFICLKALPHLDREYAVFGEVIAGMAVADQIGAVPNSGGPNNRPNRRQVMTSVFFVEPDPEAAADES